MEEDFAEMAALRRSQQFQRHQQKFGDRSAVKTVREKQEIDRAAKEREELSAPTTNRKSRVDDTPMTADGATIVEEEGKNNNSKLEAMSLPLQFGSKQKVVDLNAEHAKRERKKAKEKERRLRKAMSKLDTNEANSSSNSSSSSSSSGSASNSSSNSSSSSSSSSSGAGGGVDPAKVPLPDDEEDDENESFGPAKPVETFEPAAAVGGGDGGDEDYSAIDAKWKLPIANEIVLGGHTRAVSAMALDRSGSRLLTGSYDYTVKMWDFNGMTDALRNFRSIEPQEGHPIKHLHYSMTGDQFLCITGSPRPKIYDRDGKELCQFLRGDMYLHDLHKTNGHVTAVTGGQWHPQYRDIVMTYSEDGTIRIWDVNKVDKRNNNVVKLKSAQGKMSPVTSAVYSPNGSILAGAGKDGSLQIWDVKKLLAPKHVVREAHEPDTDTSSVLFSQNNYTLVSRGGDHTVKIWDVRQFKSPIKTFENLPNEYPETDLAFSPDETLIVTGTSSRVKDGGNEDDNGIGGYLVFIDRFNLKVVRATKVADKSVVRVLWHPEINQIVAGCAEQTHVLYDPNISKKGALLCFGRKKRVLTPADGIEHLHIRLPNAIFAEEKVGRQLRAADRKNPKKSKQPQEPLPGVIGGGGRINNQTSTQFFMSKIIVQDKRKLERRDQDPREELLKYAKVAEEDPMFLGRAYAKTQPKNILHKLTEEEEKADQAQDSISNIRRA